MAVKSEGKSPTQQLIELTTGREFVPYLRELYVARRYSDADIAALLGVSRSVVHKWRKEFGISRHERTVTR